MSGNAYGGRQPKKWKHLLIPGQKYIFPDENMLPKRPNRRLRRKMKQKLKAGAE